MPRLPQGVPYSWNGSVVWDSIDPRVLTIVEFGSRRCCAIQDKPIPRQAAQEGGEKRARNALCVKYARTSNSSYVSFLESERLVFRVEKGKMRENVETAVNFVNTVAKNVLCVKVCQNR